MVKHIDIIKITYTPFWVRFMVLNVTFNNISPTLWLLVLLVGETRVPRENHRSVASH